MCLNVLSRCRWLCRRLSISIGIRIRVRGGVLLLKRERLRRGSIVHGIVILRLLALLDALNDIQESITRNTRKLVYNART